MIPSPRRVLIWFALAVFYGGLTVAYAWPIVAAIATTLPHDLGDPALNTWILWWNAHAVPLTTRWWNAPIFFPQDGAFALSETLLALAPLTSPLQWVGASPVLAYNIVFLLSFPTAALAAHALAYRLTGRHDAALLAGLAFAFSPYRVAQIPHLQMLWTCWMPLALLALHRYSVAPRARDLVLLGICWLLNAVSCGYYLAYFGVLLGLWMSWFLRTRRDWFAIVGTIGVASLPLVPLIGGYRHYMSALGASRGRPEIESFSADLSAVWAASRDTWLAGHWTFVPRPEGELYAGAVVIALAIIGAAMAWRSSRAPWWPHVRRAWFFTGLVALSAAFLVWTTGGLKVELFGTPMSVTRPHRLVGIGIWLVVISLSGDERFTSGWRRRSLLLFYALAAAAMVAFALGPIARAFGERFMDRAPYYWLMQFPGASSLRVPARFGMLLTLCLAQVAALVFARLWRDPKPLLAALFAIFIVADGWPGDLQARPVPSPLLLPGISADATVLELPTRHLFDDTSAMLRGIGHGHPLANGFSGFMPPQYNVLQIGARFHDATVLDALRQFAPLAVVIRRADDADGRYLEMVRDVPGGRLITETAVGPVYEMPRLHPPSGTAWPMLAIAGIDASVNTANTGAMHDNDLETRWTTGRPQMAGDEVQIALAEPAVVTRIELDLARQEWTYPRQLRIRGAEGSEPPHDIWTGTVAGPALLAAFHDHIRMPVVVPLPAGEAVSRIWLTNLEGDTEAEWTIGEIRLFGRVQKRP